MRDRLCLCLEVYPMCQRHTARPFPTALVLAAMCFGQVAIADVTLPAILGSNMVMQRSTDAALWGWAAPGERIRISASWSEADALATVTTGRDGPLTHFTNAGPDRTFVPATARIVGDAVVVSSDAVTDPVAVRFGWRADAEPNLFNSAGLPASTFRTDDWDRE